MRKNGPIDMQCKCGLSINFQCFVCCTRLCMCVGLCSYGEIEKIRDKYQIPLLTHANIHTFARQHTNMQRGDGNEGEGERRVRETEKKNGEKKTDGKMQWQMKDGVKE